MTREEAIRGHRAMWGWLAKHPGKTKEDYLERFDPKTYLIHNCYLCDYTGKECERCPLEWPEECCFDDGLYEQWRGAMGRKDYTRAAEIARQIAELPER